MTWDVVLRVLAGAAIPAIMAVYGLHLAVKTEEPRAKRQHEIVFLLLLLVGITLPFFAEMRDEKKHSEEIQQNKAQSDAQLEVEKARYESQLLSTSYQQGKLDTIATVLGQIRDGGHDAELAVALQALAKQKAPIAAISGTQPTTLSLDSTILGKQAIGKAIGDGVILKEDCWKEGASTTPETLKRITAWKGEAASAVASYIGPGEVNELRQQDVDSGGGTVSIPCWRAAMWLNELEMLAASHK